MPPIEQDPAPPSNVKHLRSFLRAFVATNYLLGKRQIALRQGMTLSDPAADEALTEITDQLSHGVQDHRARVLAAEVGRLMRSLSAQKLK
jgi:hypothetical protein